MSRSSNKKEFLERSLQQINHVKDKENLENFYKGCSDAFDLLQNKTQDKEFFFKHFQTLSLDEKKNVLEKIQKKIQHIRSKAKIEVYYVNFDHQKYVSLDRKKLLDFYISTIDSIENRKLVRSQFNSELMFPEEFETLKELENVTALN